MLPEKNRLKKEKDFRQVFKQVKSFSTGFLLFKATKNELGIPRFGFVVGKKISKSAVARNQIKRRLRALVQPMLEKINKGIDVVIIVLPGGKTDSFLEIEKNVRPFFKKIGILK